ncbi:MAG: rRNA pseudouridine synthase [Streptococcaceae bacterium]|jgi:16S rRNA pseudouridine516 synthase|nr:rRNA pseudouridine synthase [Streptococcaceae bacterium]
MKRLDKLLAELNFGSRKEVKEMIKKRRVSVNGKLVVAADFKVSSADTLMIDGKITAHAAFVYYLLNKPKGVISSTKDSQQTVIDLIKREDFRKDLFPVGRLDKNTTGLLLLTNDGKLAHQLLSPKKHVEKEYFAQIKGRVTQKEVTQFAAGIKISSDFTAMPSELVILKSAEISEITLVIHEGKFHQVKRMFQAVGMEVVALERIRMKNLTLTQLKRGNYRPLTAAELEDLKSDSRDLLL